MSRMNLISNNKSLIIALAIGGLIVIAMLDLFGDLVSADSGESVTDFEFDDGASLSNSAHNRPAYTRANDPAKLEISKTISHKQIYVSNSGLYPSHSTVTLTVSGVGYPGIEFNPQDTVFIMDNSDSMDENDNEFKRVEALKLYLEKMVTPDRAAIVKFSNNAHPYPRSLNL